MKPYRIIEATLITYSGKKESLEIQSEVLTKPVRIVKEKMLDAFCSATRNSSDPFVRIEVKTVPLFNL